MDLTSRWSFTRRPPASLSSDKKVAVKMIYPEPLVRKRGFHFYSAEDIVYVGVDGDDPPGGG